jgi:hypothetical protein
MKNSKQSCLADNVYKTFDKRSLSDLTMKYNNNQYYNLN